MYWFKQHRRCESLIIILFIILTDLSLLQAQPLPSRADIISMMKKVNNYWLNENATLGDKNWAHGVYHTGNMAFYQVYPDVKYLHVALRWAQQDPTWGLDGNSHNRLAAGQTYIKLYHIEPIASRLTAVRQDIRHQINQLGDDLWFAVDANYMAMPTYAWLAKVEEDAPDIYQKMWALHHHNKKRLMRAPGSSTQRYLSHGEEQDSGFSPGLYDANDHLWYRDRHYTQQQSPHGNRIYWSRGNGWGFAAHVRVLQTLPASNRHRQELIETFQDMAATLKDRQLDSGFWPVNLDDPVHARTVKSNYRDAPETSGTALFCYGMAWGINNGLLSGANYQDVVANAWNGLTEQAVHANGLLGYVQGVGQRPESSQPFDAKSTANFGVGTFLLAGSEVLKMASGNMPAAPEPGRNLALDHLSASSDAPSETPASHAVDGNINSRWSAQGYDQWIEIDLGEVKAIHRTEVYPDHFRAYQFTIEAKQNRHDAYAMIVDRRHNTDSGTAITNTFRPVAARYLRLTVDGVHPLSYTGSSVSIKEFKVFGP